MARPKVKQELEALKKKIESRIFPLPEIVKGPDGKNWKIVHAEHNIGVDWHNRTLRVPLDDNDVAHCVRMQEVGRLKWDDLSVDGMDSLLFRAVEDHRINYLLSDAGVDISAGMMTPEKEMSITRDNTGLLSRMLMTDYTDEAPTDESLKEVDELEVVELFQEVKKCIQRNPTKLESVRLTEWLLARLVEMSAAFDMSMGGEGEGSGVPMPMGTASGASRGRVASGPSFADVFQDTWDALPEDDKAVDLPPGARDELPTGDHPDLEQYAQMLEGAHRSNLVPWGQMTIEEPARTESSRGKFHKTWKSTDEGVYPRYNHRFYTDGKIFARRKKIPGGTVVIDCSGSMSLTPQQIEQVVDLAPGCVVACYSGNGTRGVLRILAKDGRRVAQQFCGSPSGGMNVVDYPALLWAYRLMHPRIWVSDAAVTGINDGQGAANIAMCMALVRKGRFFHARSVPQAIPILQRIAKYYKK